MQRPYTQPQDFNDLPQSLLFVWKTTHVLKKSRFTTFDDPLSRQVLTVDCIKTLLEQSLLERGCTLSDFCFNLTCRLCLRNYKKLKLDPALLAYITHVVSKIQNSSASIHSSIEEAKLLGRFPLPSEEALTACLQFFDKRPRISGPLPHQISSSLQLHLQPVSPHPLDGIQERTRRVAPGIEYQRLSAPNQNVCPSECLLSSQDQEPNFDPLYDSYPQDSTTTPPLEPLYTPLFTNPSTSRPLLSAPPGMSIKRQREW